MIVIVSADPQVTHILADWIVELDPSVFYLRENASRYVVDVQKTVTEDNGDCEQSWHGYSDS